MIKSCPSGIVSKVDTHKLSFFTRIKNILSEFHKEKAVFWITCFYLILEYNKPQAVYSFIDFIPWGKTFLLLGLILSIVDKTCKMPSIKYYIVLIGFSLSVFLSMIFAYSPKFSFQYWVDYYGWVLVIFLLSCVINTQTRLYLFICVYLLANLKMAQHGFKTWVLNGFGFSSWGVTGSPGWFQNSGEFSMQMAVVLPLLLAYLHNLRLHWAPSVKLFFYLFILMAVGSIVASGSRGGVIGLLAFLVWMMFSLHNKLKILIIIFFISSLTYFSMSDEFVQRFYDAGTDKTSQSRLLYWEYGKEIIFRHTFTGIGFRNWTLWVEEMHPEILGLIPGKIGAELIHNSYLEVATELGVIGFIFYVLLIIQIYVLNKNTMLKLNFRNSFLYSSALGLNGSLFVYLFPSFFMSVAYYPYLYILLAMSICLNVIANQDLHEKN